MNGKRWICCILTALLLCWAAPGTALAAEAASGTASAVVGGIVEFDYNSSLQGGPPGAAATATPVSLVARQGIVVAGPVLRLDVSGIPAELWQSGLLMKMPCQGEDAVLAYYNQTRQPWPAWEMVPGSTVVKQNGNCYALGRITKPGIYAPITLNARLIADSITEEQIPVQYGERFVFPQIPAGYGIKIMNTSKPELVGTDGQVGVPPYYFDTAASVNFRIFKGDDYADSGHMMAKVLAPASAAQAKRAYTALKSIGTALGPIQYASSYDELQGALAAWRQREFPQMQHLFGRDVKPEQFLNLINRVDTERLRILTAHGNELLKGYGSSETEARMLMDIYSIRAWQEVCKEEPYLWFTQALDGMGWSFDTLLSIQNSLSRVIDADGQGSLNHTRALLRQHTELAGGQRHLARGEKAAYELRFFGENTGLNVNDYVQWRSSNTQLFSFSDQQGQPAAGGSLNPLWQGGDGEAVISAGSKSNLEPPAYIVKFKVGSNVPPGLFVESLPDGLKGTPYRVDLLAYGGYGVRDWKISSGRLPAGLELADGVIKGIPMEYGNFSFTVQFKDTFYKDTKNYELYVLPENSEENLLQYQRSQLWYHYLPAETEHLSMLYTHAQAVNDKQWQEILGPYFNSKLLQQYR